jgi:hypothetical protein
LTIGDCRLAIDGLTIEGRRSTNWRLTIAIMSTATSAVINPSIAKLAIVDPSIVNRQPTIGN